MKYAIVECGGKQYKAVEGASIEVDLLKVDAGSLIELETVLLVVDGDMVEVGAPTVKKASVKATVEGDIKGPKLVVFKYSPKKRIRVKTGHRAQYTRLKIEKIEVE
jgi:large subunit ribosomal protein L21